MYMRLSLFWFILFPPAMQTGTLYTKKPFHLFSIGSTRSVEMNRYVVIFFAQRWFPTVRPESYVKVTCLIIV